MTEQHTADGAEEHQAGEHGDHEEHEGHVHGEHDHHDHEHVAYPDAVAQYRADKDEFFRTAANSPVPAAERATFPGSPTSPSTRHCASRASPSSRTPGASRPASRSRPRTTSSARPSERASSGSTIDGTPHALTGYTFAGGGSESVFVPFLDRTSGTETYGAGRYLDLDPEHDGTYALDFNLAYHPSCVYDPRFSCPLTPAENRLPIRIEAGERLAASGSGSA